MLELTNRNALTFKKGATADAILLALGDYVPEEVSPSGQEIDRENESSEYYQVNTTADPAR